MQSPGPTSPSHPRAAKHLRGSQPSFVPRAGQLMRPSPGPVAVPLSLQPPLPSSGHRPLLYGGTRAALCAAGPRTPLPSAALACRPGTKPRCSPVPRQRFGRGPPAAPGTGLPFLPGLPLLSLSLLGCSGFLLPLFSGLGGSRARPDAVPLTIPISPMVSPESRRPLSPPPLVVPRASGAVTGICGQTRPSVCLSLGLFFLAHPRWGRAQLPRRDARCAAQ